MWAAQVAAVAAWLDNEALEAFLGGPHVFEESVPEGMSVARYIVVGEQTAIPRRVMRSRGASATMAAHAWTRGAPNRADVVEIVRLMDAALLEPLTLEGFGAARLKNEFSTVISDPDPELRHAPVRYRINAFASA
jgi:hypothetical protein